MKAGRTAIVIGGGVVGVTSAHALARDGWRVRILDRYDRPAGGASHGNGGQLSYGYASAAGTPSLLRQMPGLLIGSGDAFRMSLGGREGHWRWLARFVRECLPAASRRNTLSLLQLAEESRAAMDHLLSQYPIEFGLERAGKLVILPNDVAVRAARLSVEAKRAAGVDLKVISAEEACEIEPELRATGEPFAGATYIPGDDSGDCARFCEGLLGYSQTEHGTEFRGGVRVERIESGPGGALVTLGSGEAFECDLAVVATGSAARELLAPRGHAIPIQPMKGYSFTAPLGPHAPLVAISDIDRRLVFTHRGDRMLVAGIAELGRVDTRVDQARLDAMIAAARASLPEAALYDEADGGWAGLRPMTPDSQPITRMLEPGIAVNAGHGMLGWTLAMGSAERLSAAVRDAA